MDPSSAALSAVSAMITPAVIMSACGTLVLATNQRLSSSVDRVRQLSNRLEEFANTKPDLKLLEERRAVVFEQLDLQTSRARLLQRALTKLYLALSAFVVTSVAIGLAAVTKAADNWAPIACGLFGAGLLTYACLLLILEARLATTAVRVEMDFIWRLGTHHAPTELLSQRQPRRTFFRLGRRSHKTGPSGPSDTP